MLWAELLLSVCLEHSWGPGHLMGSSSGPTRIKKCFLNTNHRLFSSVSTCGTKPGNLCVQGRGCYKWISREDKQKKINRHGSRLGMPVILVLGRCRQEEQEFKVILLAFLIFFSHFVGSSPCRLLTISFLPQWSILTAASLFCSIFSSLAPLSLLSSCTSSLTLFSSSFNLTLFCQLDPTLSRSLRGNGRHRVKQF